MPSVADTMKSKVGWDEGYARRVRLITGVVGLVLLFSGVVCQWWAGNNFADVPLTTLCEAYSGEKDVMTAEDFKNGKDDYYKRVGNEGPPITLSMIASQFVGEDFSPSRGVAVDQFLYSNPSFWCKYLPACPAGATCEKAEVVSRETWTRAAWPGRKISEKPSWGIASGVDDFSSTRIRCGDKAKVYTALLESIFKDFRGDWSKDPESDAYWSQAAVDTAGDEMYYSCMRSKGSTGYILSLGPFLSSMTALICLLSLCRWFQGPTTASAAEGFAIVSVALTLVGFWVVNYRTDNEFLQAYMFCGRNKVLFEPPFMVSNGVYFDGTPCIDINSVGDKSTNPYVRTSLRMTAVYTAGGVCNLLATILLLVSVSKIKEHSKLTKFQTLEASDEL